MKVLIACSVTPFAQAAHERRAHTLCDRLIAAGHESEVLRVPFAGTPVQRLPAQLVMMRSLESWNADHLVALDLPASLLRHPRKSLWIGAEQSLAQDATPALRALLRSAASEALGESRSAFCVSHAAGRLLRETLGLSIAILPVPPRQRDALPGEYILAAPPHDPADTRLLEALAAASPEVRLLVAGTPAAPAQEQGLRDAAAALGVGARVRFDLRSPAGPTFDQAIDGHLASAVAVICSGGADDDDLAIAAASSGKALIANAANATSLLRPHLSGWLAPPDAAGMAAILDNAWHQRHRSLAYGAHARALLRVSGIDWPPILEALLA